MTRQDFLVALRELVQSGDSTYSLNTLDQLRRNGTSHCPVCDVARARANFKGNRIDYRNGGRALSLGEEDSLVIAAAADGVTYCDQALRKELLDACNVTEAP